MTPKGECVTNTRPLVKRSAANVYTLDFEGVVDARLWGAWWCSGYRTGSLGGRLRVRSRTPPCVGHPATVASPEVDGFANGSQTPPREGLLSRCTLGNNNNNNNGVL